MAGSQAKVASKRKNVSGKLFARKKLKTHRNADDLPWRSVRRPVEAGVGGDDGILELEEVDGVEVVYEDTDGGRVARFKVADEVEPETKVGPDFKSQDDAPIPRPEDDEFNSEELLPNWHTYSLHPQLFRSLYERKFLSPTPIQAAALPHALSIGSCRNCTNGL
ncbi:hypothetical protein BD779DRAFT_323125 [Infundibulicybe gibba]|nr:hypothetical protein BD779DRAFT_323125 [Infundibulicybe gibba]